ncbi:MAG: hypothetical protein UR26_C0005G0026 [candidate division TM6 bacterium GW2011_GWF2_32_72]|nr:MAG: hypothetical protein UR26_C0005G0026 [candidate division TM6 bacterium GW2011_GWF2_32_72]
MNFETLKSKKNKYSEIVLSSRQISWIGSGIVIFSFFVFVSGYFLGCKNSVEKFTDKMEKEAFVDNIHYSMADMYDKGENIACKEDLRDDLDQIPLLENKEEKMEIVAAELPEKAQVVKNENVAEDKVTTNISDVKKSESGKLFYAELVGFGSAKAAQKFVEKMEKNGLKISLKKRQSKGKKGRVVTWYQAVTDKYLEKEELQKFVDKIKTIEALHDVRICV